MNFFSSRKAPIPPTLVQVDARECVCVCVLLSLEGQACLWTFTGLRTSQNRSLLGLPPTHHISGHRGSLGINEGTMHLNRCVCVCLPLSLKNSALWREHIFALLCSSSSLPPHYCKELNGLCVHSGGTGLFLGGEMCLFFCPLSCANNRQR